MLAVLLAVLRAPNQLAAALELDQRFHLKERVTTSLSLDAHTASLPAGQALLADTTERVADLDVGTRFPLRIRWSAALVPLAGLALAAVVFFPMPARTQATTTPVDEAKQPIRNPEEVEKTIADANEKAREKRTKEKGEGDKPAPFDDEVQKILNKERQTKDDLRDRMKDLTELRAKIQKDQDDLKDRAQAMKDQLQQMNRDADNNIKDGPAKDMQKALQQGDMKQAREELEKLRRKLVGEDKDHPMTEKDKDQLKQQLQQMKDQLQRAADPAEAKKELERLLNEKKITSEQLQKAMEQVKQNLDRMAPGDKEQLKEIADALQAADKAIKEGGDEKAADELKRAGEAMRKSDELDNAQKANQNQQDRLDDLQNAMKRGMGPGVGEERRPEGKDQPTASIDSQLKGPHDPKGAMQHIGYGPGSNFKKKSSSEMAGDIKQASQEAPDALDRQRVPRAASEMAKGYWEKIRKLGGDDEKKDK
jgi:uncharacterized coiled-coil DUF342 family protein